MNQNVVICRCQEITYGDVLNAIKDGALTVAGVKKRVGSGMGLCQGKYCEALVANIISEQTGIPLEEILPDTRRAPARPVDVTAFLED
ncbi:MAG: (2Fe-2S)-binding protein [Oscillospiraceae bacterium]|nr:(2Fe-2S)-binding protein [Oscillospiraceae bacterium]